MKVSILCNTYNHEATIALAIEGFLMQKSDFPFEILIHDDASTDNTRKIIETYVKLNPDLIKPIFQDINQTRLGKSVTEINLSRATGIYIAICEGDDYWCDPLKLQRQVDVLDTDTSIQLVGHASRVRNQRFPLLSRIWSAPTVKYTIETLIELRGIVFASNTMMFRKSELVYPMFAQDFKVADVKRVLFSALQGRVISLKECMSVYHVGVEGSWTDRIRFDVNRVIEHYQSEIDFYNAFDAYTEGNYHEPIKSVINKLNYLIRLHEREHECLSSEYHLSMSKVNQVRDRIHFYFPNTFQKLSRLRYRYFI